MKTLAIIPAKGSSTGIPNKNLVKLGGHELIKHTLDAVSASEMVDWVVLATDSPTIRGVASGYDFLKSYVELPSHLTTASVQVDEVVLYAYRDIDERMDHDYDTLIVLQPTSPLRTAQHIDEALQLYQTINKVHAVRDPLRPKESVISVWEPGWPYEVGEAGYVHSYSMRPHIRPGREAVDEMKVVVENGAIYIVDAERFSNEKSFRCIVTTPYYMDKQSSIEIDEPIDLEVAEAILAYENNS